MQMTDETSQLLDDDEQFADDLMTTKGAKRSELDVDPDGHALGDLDSERQAPIEAVARNVVNRYDQVHAFLREFLANAHTACIQRAKWECVQADVNVDLTDVRAVLDAASDHCGYEPVIHVVRNKDDTVGHSLYVEDNGIGVPSNVARAIRDIGLSGWHDDGSTNGQFGQGTMSGFLPVGDYGEFDMLTHSPKSGENYRARWTLTDLDKLPGERDGYGTTFLWPYLTDEATDVDYYKRTREYAEGMLVPVLYDEIGSDGTKNGNRCDEFTGQYIEDRYADDALTVAYEDEFVKAVWSPQSPEGWSSSIKTWCGYQPINRNDSSYGGSAAKHMPSAFDLRIKREDGPIVSVPDDADQSLVGKVPLQRPKYERLDETDGFVVRDAVPDGAVITPEPTDDRDRLESRHVDEFVTHVSVQLRDQLYQMAGDVMDSLDTIDDLQACSKTEQEVVIQALSDGVTIYAENDPERLVDEIETAFGATVDQLLALNLANVVLNISGNDVRQFISAMNRARRMSVSGDYDRNNLDDDTVSSIGDNIELLSKKVQLAPRDKDASRVSRSRYRSTESLYTVLDLVGDDGDVYMAKTLSTTRKVALAWELHEDNQVVHVNDYDQYERQFGWQKLKELPNQNFSDEFDGLDESFLDEYDPGYGNDTNDSSPGPDLSSFGFDIERAKRRTVKVRYKTQNGKYFERDGASIHDALDAGETIGRGSRRTDTLVVYDETDGHRTDAGEQVVRIGDNVSYAVVPQYVFEYLQTADNVYTEDEYINEYTSQTIDFDWTADGVDSTATLDALSPSDVFVFDDDALTVAVDTDTDAGLSQLATYIESHNCVESVNRLTLVRDLSSYSAAFKGGALADGIDTTPTVIVVKDDRGRFNNYQSPNGVNATGEIQVTDLYWGTMLPELNQDAPEWAHFKPTIGDTDLIEQLQLLEDDGGFMSQRIEIDDSLNSLSDEMQPRSNHYYIVQTCERLNELLDDD